MEKKAFLLRIAPEIHEALQRWAGDELRSLNGQIEFLLREALVRGGRLPAAPKPPPAGGSPAPRRQ